MIAEPPESLPRLQTQPPLRVVDLSTPERALDVLERFGRELQQCDQATRQVPLLLSAIRDSLGADAVYWYPGDTPDLPECVGTPKLSPEWCKSFTQRLVRTEITSDSQILRNFLDPGAKPEVPWPYSVAMIRVSRTWGNWLGALSFHPRRTFQPSDLKAMHLARRMMLNHRQQSQIYEKLRETMFGLVRCLTATIDARDPFTWGHSERVARIAVRLAKQMSLPGTALSDLYLGGLLHDIGKIGIRDDVLLKPGALTADEYKHIQEHVIIGDRLISNVKSLQHLRVGVRGHHERWDGKGYPDHLSGENIPLQARVLAVADSCDALMSARPYRPAMPTEQIDSIMRDGAGSQWDPAIIEHFMACRHELYPICQRGLGDSVVAAVERALSVSGDSSKRKKLTENEREAPEGVQAEDHAQRHN